MGEESGNEAGPAVIRRGLLIVDHGTRHDDAHEALARLAAEVGEIRAGWLVEAAHMELATPDFDAGIDALIARGATRIHVHLHFLTAGYHVRETIPELVTKARARHPRVVIEVGEPLGHDPRIADLVVERLDRVELQERTDRHNSKE